MQLSTFLTATGAVLATANPIHVYRDVVVEEVQTVVDVVVVTAIEPAPAAPSSPLPAAPVSPDIVTVAVGQSTNAPAAPIVAHVPDRASLSTPTDFASTATYYHNIHRFNNSAGALVYDDSIANSAAVLAATCNFHHDTSIDGGGYGQNIAMWASSGNPQALGASKAIAAATSEMWYNGEVDLFPSSGYGQGTPDMTNFDAWGHYSQVVWKATQRVGCAAQYCAPGTMNPTMGAWFTVCNYQPPGNVGGEYGGNVGQPLGGATVSVNN